MTTANQIITRAMREIGALDVTVSADGDEADACLDTLNSLIDSWVTNPSTAYNNQEVTITLPSGTASRTIGLGQQINVVRPARIESAYARYSNLDRPIEIVEKEQYDSILIKTLGTSWPEVLWYDGGLPTGNVYFWPIPAATIDVHLTVLNYLAEFSALTTDQTLSRGTRRALELNLAVEIAPQFNLPVSPNLERRASGALRALKRMNSVVPELDTTPHRSARLGRFLAGL